MASEKQRKQDICVLAVSYEQCNTLSIEKVGTLAKVLPKASMHFSNGTCLRYAIKNLAFTISTCLPLSRWYCGKFQCESLNTTRSRVQVSRAAQHHYLSVAILIWIKILSFMSSIEDSKKVYNIDGNINKCWFCAISCFTTSQRKVNCDQLRAEACMSKDRKGEPKRWTTALWSVLLWVWMV